MNFKALITALALFVGIGTTSAISEPTFSAGADKTFTVSLEDWTVYNVDVTITDIYGITLLSDNITKTAGRIYNLKNLDAGTYIVSVSNDMKTINTEITVDYTGVSVEATTVDYKPQVTVADGYFDVNTLALDSPVDVTLLDSDGTQVFTKEYRNTPSFNKRYDTTQLPAGEYTVQVSKGTQVTTATIVK